LFFFFLHGISCPFVPHTQKKNCNKELVDRKIAASHQAELAILLLILYPSLPEVDPAYAQILTIYVCAVESAQIFHFVFPILECDLSSDHPSENLAKSF
jgi:hypothetical protein